MEAKELRIECEEFFKSKFGNELKANDSWVIRFAIEFAQSQLDKFHISEWHSKHDYTIQELKDSTGEELTTE